MSLEAASIGVPTVYFPTVKERSFLQTNFLGTIEQSPNEIRQISDINDIVSEVLSFDGTKPSIQIFSERYAQYCSDTVIKQTASGIQSAVSNYHQNADKS